MRVTNPGLTPAQSAAITTALQPADVGTMAVLNEPLPVASGGTESGTVAQAQVALGLGHRPAIPGGSNIFASARTVFATTPEFGWTILNRTALTSANENTTTGDALHMVHGNTSTDWTSTGTWTAPVRYYTLDYTGGPLEIVGQCYSNGAANYEQSGIIVFDTANKNAFIKAGVGNSAARPGLSLESYLGGLQSVAVTAGQRNAGVWIRIVLTQDQAAVYYNLTAGAEPPTSWTLLTSGNGPGRWKTLGIGTMMQTVNTAGTLTGGCRWFGWASGEIGYPAIASFQAAQ